MKKGRLIIISGASGTGKGTVCNALLKSHPELAYSISATTRAKREGEVDGVNYYFTSVEAFRQMIAGGGFLEWAEVYGNYYGTPVRQLEDRMASGQDILLEIDTQGALNVMKKCPDAISIFLLPPSLEELERRLRGRGTEAAADLAKRLSTVKHEIKLGLRYRYAVVNDTVDGAVATIAAIIAAEHSLVENNQALFAALSE